MFFVLWGIIADRALLEDVNGATGIVTWPRFYSFGGYPVIFSHAHTHTKKGTEYAKEPLHSFHLVET